MAVGDDVGVVAFVVGAGDEARDGEEEGHIQGHEHRTLNTEGDGKYSDNPDRHTAADRIYPKSGISTAQQFRFNTLNCFYRACYEAITDPISAYQKGAD